MSVHPKVTHPPPPPHFIGLPWQFTGDYTGDYLNSWGERGGGREAGGERHRGSKASCPRAQRNNPARSRTQTSRPGVHCTDYRATKFLIAYMHMRSSRLPMFPQMKKRLRRNTVNEYLLAGSWALILEDDYCSSTLSKKLFSRTYLKVLDTNQTNSLNFWEPEELWNCRKILNYYRCKLRVSKAIGKLSVRHTRGKQGRWVMSYVWPLQNL